jgi:hypothetical protein
MVAAGRHPPPAPPPALAPAWREWILRSAEQGLFDLAASESAEVVFARVDEPRVATAYANALTERALARGFATAQLGIASDRGFDALDALVRTVLTGLHAPRAREDGFFAMLDAFVARHGQRALSRFDDQCESSLAVGDLTSLARAYIASADQPRIEKRRLRAWLDGTDLPRAEGELDGPIAPLVQRTAKRALTELTRVVRALGHHGTLLVFREGDALLHLPAARREGAYTVLRELVDNADSARGLFATRIVVLGSTALYEGTKSLASLTPLATRVAILPGASPFPPPHRPLVDLTAPAALDDDQLAAHAAVPPRAPAAPSLEGEAATAALRAVIRGCQGLPPIESILSMSVGQERIDATIDRLFEVAAMDGSVFTLLTGDYGTGKTHLLLHLAARALKDMRPVLRLSLERLDVDLGNPQRHLRRLLESAVLPRRASEASAIRSVRATPIDRLLAWTRAEAPLAKLVATLEEIAASGSEAGNTAQRALRRASNPKTRPAALDAFLGGADLVEKSGNAGYRHDAYGRLLLWIELLERLEKCAGPVLIIDEAENLYRIGVSRSERRTALRSLSFYCGGALPRSCVVMAITPDRLGMLREESRELLEEVSEQATLLASEDAAMLRRRLVRLKPLEVPALAHEHREALLARVRATHAKVRGKRSGAEWTRLTEKLLAEPTLSPRDLVRRATDWLESEWWLKEE